MYFQSHENVCLALVKKRYKCKIQQKGTFYKASRYTSHSYVTCRKRGKHVWISFRSLKKVDTNALIADLNRTPCNILDTYSNDLDEILNTWIKLVLDVVDTHAPMKKKGVKSPDKPSWLMKGIQEAITHRGHLKKTTRSWKNSKSFFFNTTRTKNVHMVNKAKSVAIKNELEENKKSSRLWWKAFTNLDQLLIQTIFVRYLFFQLFLSCLKDTYALI